MLIGVMSGRNEYGSAKRTGFVNSAGGVIALIAMMALSGLSAAKAQVTGYVNNLTNPAATARADGEPLSSYFNVSIAGTSLYTYPAQVKAVNFVGFTSDLNGMVYNPNITDTDPEGAYMGNQGSASFVSFQPTVSGGSNTVTVCFKVATHTAITSTSQVKLASNQMSNLTGLAIIPSGSTCTNGGFSFNIQERVSSATGFGIPQQITIDIGNDFLNSLEVFANPHPDTTNGVPAGAVTATASVNGAPVTIPSGAVVHFPAGRYFIKNSATKYYFGQTFYLDDGAFIKYYTYPVTPGATRACWVNEDCAPMLIIDSGSGNAGISGWGVVDGQAQEQQAAWTGPDPNGGSVPAPGNCGSGPGPLALTLASNSTQTATVFGVIVENSCSFTLQIGAQGTSSKPVTVDNIKIFGYSGASTPQTSNADGMDVFGSSYLNITNSFIRTSDDLITLKQTNPNATAGNATPNAGINIVNNTFWNEVAHAFVIGGETYNAYNVNQPSNPIADDDITFDSNFVVHDKGKGWLFGNDTVWGGTIQNVLLSNTVVNEASALFNQGTTGLDSVYTVTGYSMAPTTGSAGSYTSVVTFTTTAQGTPVAVPGDEVLLSGFTSSEATSEGFNGKYLAIASSPLPTSTSFVATMSVPNAITSTTTGTETAAYSTVQAIPGLIGAFHMCNMNEVNGQTPQQTIAGPPPWGTSNPYITPVPNIQVIVQPSTGDPYAGGQPIPWATSTNFGKVVDEPPTFYNVTVAGTTVSNAVAGNDYYYLAVDGTAGTNSTPFPATEVEETVKIEGAYGSPQHFYYYTGVPSSNPKPNEISGDMILPSFPGSMSCPVSSLKPTP